MLLTFKLDLGNNIQRHSFDCAQGLCIQQETKPSKFCSMMSIHSIAITTNRTPFRPPQCINCSQRAPRDVPRAYQAPTVSQLKTSQNRNAGKRSQTRASGRLDWSKVDLLVSCRRTNMLAHADRAIALQSLPQINLSNYQAGTFYYVSGSVDG